MQTENVDWKKLNREERGQLIAKTSQIVKTAKGWQVPSQSGNGSYLVKFEGHEPECNCPDCELRACKCKHIYAVEFYLKQEIDNEGNTTITKGVKVSYSQDWKAYNYAQCHEKKLFMKLLSDLCSNIEQPQYKFGRPTLPLSDMIFASALKVYSTFSLRRFMSDMETAKESGFIENICTYVTVSNVMNKEEITPILKRLIKLSASPLSSVETDFAVDSSGFSTSRFARWFNYKWGKETKYRIWIKAHLISGVKTNIVTSCEITEGKSNDCPEMQKLVKETAENFDMKEVSCDKAYSSRENFDAIEEVGATPFIPFKKNTSGKARGSMVWKKMYHFFLYKHDEFLEHYHKRSNAETVFHMVKSKFKDSLRSKTKTAQINELLLKILCHNICCVIQEMFELGIKGEFKLEENINT